MSKTLFFQSGQQQKFSASSADVTIFGGGAGGGKTLCLCLEGARYVEIPGYVGMIFRRTISDIKKGGGLKDTATEVYRQLGAECREAPIDFRWPNFESKIELQGLETEATKIRFQGAQIWYLGFDELTHFTQTQFEYLRTRNRGGDGKMKPVTVATCNPDANSWVKHYIQPWIGTDGYPKPEMDGRHLWVCRSKDDELVYFPRRDEALQYCQQIGDEKQRPYSLMFIKSLLSDNPIGVSKDPRYGEMLSSQDRVTRRALLDGNWNATAIGDYFDRSWCDVVEPPADSEIKIQVRGWDIAYSDGKGDWTVGVLLQLLKNGRVVIRDVQRFRLGPGQLQQRIAQVARTDGHRVVQALFQDPAAGKAVAHTLEQEIRRQSPGTKVDIVPATKSKGEYFAIFSAAVDPEKYGDGDARNKIVCGFTPGVWTTDYLSELECWTGAEKSGQPNDQVDATSRAWLYISKHGFNPGLSVWLNR